MLLKIKVMGEFHSTYYTVDIWPTEMVNNQFYKIIKDIKQLDNLNQKK